MRFGISPEIFIDILVVINPRRDYHGLYSELISLVILTHTEYSLHQQGTAVLMLSVLVLALVLSN
jgi:hypothetical protein